MQAAVRAALLSATNLRPSLNLNFLTSTTLDPRITFSRGTNGMVTDATGKLTYAPNNLLLNSDTLSTQSVTTAAISYMLSFQGTGSIALSGAYSGSLAGTGATDRVYLKFTSTAASLTLTVTGSVTRAQLEAVTYQTTPGTYNATTSAAYYGPRFDYDPTTLAAKGLLIEEARTNLFLNSTAGGANLATQNVTVTAQAYTISFYGTGSITLSGAATATITGTGAYPSRKTYTFTPTAGTLTCTVSGTVQYANCEAGSFATSYIPTAASSATRNADAATMTGANFFSWYNQAQGTIFLTARSPASGTRILWQADDNTANNKIVLYTTGTTVKADIVTGGIAQASLTLGTISANTLFSVALAFAANDIAGIISGGSIQTASSATIPTVDRVRFGADTSGNYLGAATSNSRVYPTRLPNTTLQALTS